MAMEFELTEEQRDIKKAAKEFAEGEFDRELARELEQKHEFPWEIWRKACELGFIGIHFPEEFGGGGYGIFENVLVVEEFCRVDSGIGIALSLSDFASEVILRFGTKEQKEKYLIPLTQGKAISAGGFTEPDHGSDITLMSTQAVKEGDEFVINGTKTFITNGVIADYVVVLCQTDFDASPTYRGQSTIVVEKGTPGFEATEVGEKMGIKMTSTAELSFRDVRVPAGNLVGEENRGFYQVLEFFDESRIEIAAQAVGIAQGAYERALQYAKERTQFGRKIAEFQAIQLKLAEMATDLEAAEQLVHYAAWLKQNDKPCHQQSAMAKLFASEAAATVCDKAARVLASYGFAMEYPVQRHLRDIRFTLIGGGTSEILKLIIAKGLST